MFTYTKVTELDLSSFDFNTNPSELCHIFESGPLKKVYIKSQGYADKEQFTSLKEFVIKP